MQENASDSADIMKRNVTNATSQMANQSIRDWDRLRNAYSTPIHGSVSVTRNVRETTTRSRAIEGNTELRNIPRIMAISDNFNVPNMNDYITVGAYYNSRTKESNLLKVNDKSLDIKEIIRKITSITNATSKNDIKVMLNIENFNGTDKKQLLKLVDKMAELIDIKLNEISEKKNKRLGGVKIGI